jgi:NCAIR mutase (PurE)-related protein
MTSRSVNCTTASAATRTQKAPTLIERLRSGTTDLPLRNEAADYIAKLEAQIKTVENVGFDTHHSWGCSEEFTAGWRACREQVQEAFE